MPGVLWVQWRSRAACGELATAAVLLLREFPVPEPSPPSHCDMFAVGSLLESLLQSPPRKSVVEKHSCVSARWRFSVAAENSPSVNRLYCQPVRRWKGTSRLGMC